MSEPQNQNNAVYMALLEHLHVMYCYILNGEYIFDGQRMISLTLEYTNLCFYKFMSKNNV